jgi:hypothetical protein
MIKFKQVKALEAQRTESGCDVSGSHVGEYDDSFLGYSTV